MSVVLDMPDSSVNQTVNLRLHARADQEDGGNDGDVSDAPGAQPRQGEFFREPKIESEKDERSDPCRHDAHREREGDFPFQLRVHNTLLGFGEWPTRAGIEELTGAAAWRRVGHSSFPPTDASHTIPHGSQPCLPRSRLANGPRCCTAAPPRIVPLRAISVRRSPSDSGLRLVTHGFPVRQRRSQ